MFPLPVTISVHLARSCIPTIFPLGRSSQPHSHPDSAPRRLNAFVFPLRTGSIFLSRLLFYSQSSEGASRRGVTASGSNRQRKSTTPPSSPVCRWGLCTSEPSWSSEACRSIKHSYSEREGGREKQNCLLPGLKPRTAHFPNPRDLFIARIHVGKEPPHMFAMAEGLFLRGPCGGRS